MLYVREALSVQVCKGRGKGGGDLSSRDWAFFTILDSRVCTGKWAFSACMSGGRGFCKITSKTMQDVSIAELTWMLAEGSRYMGCKLGSVFTPASYSSPAL